MAQISDITVGKTSQKTEHPRIPSYLLRSLGVAVVATVVFYIVVLLLFRSTYMVTMLTDRGSIPYMTAFLTFLALSLLGGAYHVLKHEFRNFQLIASILSEVPHIDQATSADISRTINEQVKNSKHSGLVFDRVQRVLRRITNRGNAGDIAALLTEQAEIDRAILSSSYGLVRFIAWLIPVLGFIGTVGGISFAIALLPELFEGGAESMQDQLGPITGNLGVAFDTTFLALIQIAIIMFVLFIVQKRGTELLNTFDEFCLDNLLGKVRGGGTQEEEGPFADLANLLSAHVENMEAKFEKAAENVVKHLVENEQQRWGIFTESFRATAREHHETIRATCEVTAGEARKLGEDLKTWEPQFREAMKELVRELGVVEDQRAVKVIDSLKGVGTQVGQMLAGVSEEFGAASNRTIQAQEKASAELCVSMGTISDLLRTSGELQALQQTLQANLAALNETGAMRKAVEQLGVCLADLTPVLSELQKKRRMQVRIVEEPEGE